MSQKHKNLLILIILSILFNLWVFYPAFDKYTISDDVVTSAYLFYNLKYGIFENDVNNLAHTHAVPIGFLYTLYILSFIFPFLTLTALLPFVLSTFCVIMLYLIGSKLKNARLGYFLSIIFLLYSSTFYFFYGATLRAFQFPFILLFIYLFINDKFVWCCFLAILSSTFYPPLNSVLIVALFFSMFRLKGKRTFRFIPNKKRICFLLIAILISFLLLLPSLIKSWDSQHYSFDEAKEMQEFNKWGSHYYFGNIVLDFFSKLLNPHDRSIFYGGLFALENHLSVVFTFIILLSVFFFLLLFHKKAIYLPSILYSLFFSSIILFLISHIMNRFYFMSIMALPLYYSKAVLPIFLLFFVSVNLERLVVRFGKKNAFTFLAIIVVLFAPFYISNFSRDFDKCQINQKLTEIRELGNDVLIAGHPFFIRCIPLFNKQRILFSVDATVLDVRTNYETIKERMNDFFYLIYSNEASQFRTFCDKYGVTHLILDKDLMESNPYTYENNNFLNQHYGIIIINGTLPDNYFLKNIEIPENKSIAILQCSDKDYIRYI